VATLEVIHHADQDLRRQMSEVIEKYGWESEEMKAFSAKISYNDSINVIKIQQILDEHGWLGLM